MSTTFWRNPPNPQRGFQLFRNSGQFQTNQSQQQPQSTGRLELLTQDVFLWTLAFQRNSLSLLVSERPWLILETLWSSCDKNSVLWKNSVKPRGERNAIMPVSRLEASSRFFWGRILTNWHDTVISSSVYLMSPKQVDSWFLPFLK